MKFIFLLALVLTGHLTRCSYRAYRGYVCDSDSRLPIEGVLVNDYKNGGATTTGPSGYFSLKPRGNLLAWLAFSKAGYGSDTMGTIKIYSGESIGSAFKGDTIYLRRLGRH